MPSQHPGLALWGRSSECGMLDQLPLRGVVAAAAAGSDVVRSMAQRADATITEIKGSHVIMSQFRLGRAA